jgi:hypothetical protein
VEVIAETVNHSRYKSNTYSIRCVQDQALLHKVRAELIELDPEVEVQVDAGNVRVGLRSQGLKNKKRIETAKKKTAQITGVKSVEIDLMKDMFERIIDSGKLR